jgi:hypothetical protein
VIGLICMKRLPRCARNDFLNAGNDILVCVCSGIIAQVINTSQICDKIWHIKNFYAGCNDFDVGFVVKSSNE